jgi:hypothetical protein
MVLDDNDHAHAIRSATGYHRQGEWSRWVKPLAASGQAWQSRRFQLAARAASGRRAGWVTPVARCLRGPGLSVPRVRRAAVAPAG